MIPTEQVASTLLPLLGFLDYVGIAVFAVSGALLAAQKRLTLVTFIFFAVATGVGGGTARDLLIGAPVFWTDDNWTLLICFFAALLVWLTPKRIWGGNALLWFDAVGLAAYSTYGAAKALAFGVAPVPAFAAGVLTACLGGIVRDVLANEPSILLKAELYVTAAALSAGLMVGLTLLDVPTIVTATLAVLAGVAPRGMAIVKGWSLPGYSR
jgi:uncharacterized membrane protein YeiH